MILEALSVFGIPSQPDFCCYVSDTSQDLQAAAGAGIKQRVLVTTGYGKGLMGGLEPPSYKPMSVTCTAKYTGIKPSAFPFLYRKNLAEAVDCILDENGTSITQLL